MRIEFTERYYDPYTEEELDHYADMNLPLPKREPKFRRIYLRIDDVFAPKEIPGKKSYCHIETNMGDMIIVKGGYDDICQQIDDFENQYMADIDDVEAE